MLALMTLLLLLGSGAPVLPAQDGPPASGTPQQAVENTGPEYGPLFKNFLKKNPSFVSLLKERRYQEAAERLDRWAREQPGDVEIALARAYLFLEQERLEEALREALDYRGPDPYEILHRVGLSARKLAVRDRLDVETRARIIELGLLAESRAITAREHAHEPVLSRSLLLREKAKLTADPAASQALLAEADQLRETAARLQEQEEERTLRLSGPVTRPEKISGAFLDRHEESLRVGVSGTVILEATIDEQGNVQDARVLKGVHEELDRKALENIRTWKFKPATLNGKPVKVFYSMTMSFK